MNLIRKFLNYLVRCIMWIICLPLPINRKKITVSNFEGNGYGDNPKYIIEEILKERKNLQIIWAVNSPELARTLPSNVEWCLFNSCQYVYHLSTSSVWIDNCRKSFVHKKQKQLYLQTWHGGGIVKRVEKQIVEYLGKWYIRNAIRDAGYSDIMVSDGKMQSEYYYKYYWFSGYVAQTGAPRNDILFCSNSNEIVKKVKDFYNIPYNVKLVLYAPTFRKDHSLEYYNIDYIELTKELENKFLGKYMVLVRLHPGMIDKFSALGIENNENIINASYYSDVQELIVASDIMISDYSSIMFDFSLTMKPTIRYATDIERYSKERGGMCFDIKQYPYPLARNNTELIEVIRNFDYELYLKNVNIYFELIGEIRSDHASKDCSKIVLDFIDSNMDKEKVYLRNSHILIKPS